MYLSQNINIKYILCIVLFSKIIQIFYIKKNNEI